ncbi:hypothetical protein D3C81_1167150 [compost metagenome]
MQDLQANLAASGMHGLGDDTVLVSLLLGAQLGCAGIHATFIVGRDTTSDHQPNAATGTLCKIRSHAFEATGTLLKACVHRPHQGAVSQGGEAQVERGQQVRIAVGSHGTVPHVA